MNIYSLNNQIAKFYVKMFDISQILKLFSSPKMGCMKI